LLNALRTVWARHFTIRAFSATLPAGLKRRERTAGLETTKKSRSQVLLPSLPSLADDRDLPSARTASDSARVDPYCLCLLGFRPCRTTAGYTAAILRFTTRDSLRRGFRLRTRNWYVPLEPGENLLRRSRAITAPVSYPAYVPTHPDTPRWPLPKWSTVSSQRRRFPTV